MLVLADGVEAYRFGDWMACLQERGLFGFIWPQSPSCPSPAPQLLPSSAGRALSKQVRGIALKLPSDTRGFSGLSSAAVNHLVLAASKSAILTPQILSLGPCQITWSANVWPLDTYCKWYAVMVNGIGQLGSFWFQVLEKLTLRQFHYLWSKVIIGPILFGENSLKTYIRHLAWSLAHRKYAGQNSSGMWLVLGSTCQKGHQHPRRATGGWRIVLEIWWLRGDANDNENYLESSKYRKLH